jgi:hypothetical protein
MSDIQQHINQLFTAELQFRLASAVRLATSRNAQPLDLPTEWSHGAHTVTYEEIALRPEQADYAACFLHKSATFLMAVAIRNAIRAVVSEPKSSTDPNIIAAYQIARLIRNAFTHSPFTPIWSIDPDCRHKIFSIPNIISLDTSELDGKIFDWRDYGGPLALFRLCRFVRQHILKDPMLPRTHVPVLGTAIYQQGNLVLTQRNRTSTQQSLEDSSANRCKSN